MTVRPLSPPVVPFDIPEGEVTQEAFAAWYGSRVFDAESKYFGDYPKTSLLAAPARIFIYHAIRVMKPDLVAEVGTFRAGTSEVIARALCENRKGKLVTTDPFGAERCPQAISSWPDELQQFVEFFPLNSMAFFLAIEGSHKRLDIAFIDGKHDYEFALFDILMAARNLRRGGLLLIDNVEQQGPLFAALEFLRNNPTWQIIGRDNVSRGKWKNPLVGTYDRGSFDGHRAPFLVVRAPDAYAVYAVPFSTTERRVKPQRYSGLRIRVSQNNEARGALFWEAIYRVFPDDKDPLEVKSTGEIGSAVSGTLAMDFNALLEFRDPGPRTMQVNLFLDSDSPAPFLFDQIELVTDSDEVISLFPQTLGG